MGESVEEAQNPYLRPLRAGDVQDVLAAFDSNPDMARQGRVRTVKEAEQYVGRLLAPSPPHFPWAVVLGTRLVGLVGVSVDKPNKSGWFWYWMHQDGRGCGWTKRAAATVADWALTGGGLERLELGHRGCYAPKLGSFTGCRH